MPIAIRQGTTLALNTSNDPSIPHEGLELVDGRKTPVTTQQAAYLKTLPGVTILDDARPATGPTASKE